MKQTNDENQTPASKPQPQFTDFAGMHRDILPHYSERSLRKLVRDGSIPSIVLPNGRKRTFFIPGVIAALLRRSTGGLN